ncbi:LysR substrate-binding domain-containing protein [Marinomonas foliarum]|uniref:LysR family transcriptional regulator n=1 Tax=Marinomonas foliarum TaxID=491950 RepID=A0ABX7IMR0_9GAMM|nr:LysR substrate-binding domain-containing protein [Marinomonas foliarum]QRV23411.1 LysR family transcriptional regulator [Marinomonas foliarum]
MNDINISSTDMNLLKVFEALYIEGSASRAAQTLGLTQSTVSASLRRLRTLYNDRLFVREGKGLAPTTTAHQLKPLIFDALDKIRETLQLVNHNTTNYQNRTIVIGLSDDFEIALAGKLIEKLALDAPHLRPIFRQAYSVIVPDLLQDNVIDVAITSGTGNSRFIRRQLLGKSHYSCIINRRYTQKLPLLTLEEFISFDHVLVSSAGYVGIVDNALARNHLKRHIIASTTHFAALPFFLQQENRIATIPAHAATALAQLDDLTVLPCPLELESYPVEAAWRAKDDQSPLIQTVVASVKTVLKSILS